MHKHGAALRGHVRIPEFSLPSAYDGIQICAKVRAHAETKDAPIIIISVMSE